RIQIASVGSPGQAVGDAARPKVNLDLSSFTKLGSVLITFFSNLTADAPALVDGPPGRISIRGDSLTMAFGSVMGVSSFNLDPAGAGVDIDVRGAIAFTDGASVLNASNGHAAVPSIEVDADSIALVNVGTSGFSSFSAF